MQDHNPALHHMVVVLVVDVRLMYLYQSVACLPLSYLRCWVVPVPLHLLIRPFEMCEKVWYQAAARQST